MDVEAGQATVFSDLADFFTTTIPQEAEKIWRVFVSAITSLSKWVMEEATKLWNSAVDAVKGILKSIATFLKKFWNLPEEFVRIFQQCSDNLKNHIADGILNATDEARKIAFGRLKQVLQGEGYEVEKMSEEQLRNVWKEYMKRHPVTPDVEREAEYILNGDSKGYAVLQVGGVKINDVLQVGGNKINVVLQEGGDKGRWNTFIKAQPLTPEEEAEANNILNGPAEIVLQSA